MHPATNAVVGFAFGFILMCFIAVDMTLHLPLHLEILFLLAWGFAGFIYLLAIEETEKKDPSR